METFTWFMISLSSLLMAVTLLGIYLATKGVINPEVRYGFKIQGESKSDSLYMTLDQVVQRKSNRSDKALEDAMRQAEMIALDKPGVTVTLDIVFEDDELAVDMASVFDRMLGHDEVDFSALRILNTWTVLMTRQLPDQGIGRVTSIVMRELSRDDFNQFRQTA